MLDAPSDFCRLWLFRHPSLEEPAARTAVGGGDADLCRRGRAQVLEWREWLEGAVVHEVHASPQRQCREAGAALAKAVGCGCKTDERLRDQSMGAWQGLSWEEILRRDGERLRAFFANFADAVPPGGESLGASVERVLSWWSATSEGAAGKSLAVVMPGSTLAGFAAAMLGMRLSRCISLQIPHGSCGVLDVFENGVRIAAWNLGAAL
ncbi:MAG: histidine phosphatase family protein [Planctomycetota bacterium]